jgi:hexosaminidase
MKYCYLFLLCSLIACNQTTQSTKAPVHLTETYYDQLIPKPVEAKTDSNAFEINASTMIIVDSNSMELMQMGNYLSKQLSTATGFAIPVSPNVVAPLPGNIYLTIKPMQAQQNEEAYELIINQDSVLLSANKPAGLFRGIQTIRQLLPATIEGNKNQDGPWYLATGFIKDYPNYAHRGSMLDVCRHFFGVQDVKRYIDFLAYYKMNVFHWHLSDDQGWRIEIKSWPKLTSIGGSTQVNGGGGGFYTQEQYKEIVQYAAERYITVIPEIDMPGHTNAALASYPELNCNPNDPKPKLYTGTEVGFSTLCTSSEKVYAFVDSVIRELAVMTPGQYIHIGGDESKSTAKNDYIQFMNRVQGIVKKYGKQVIGWDEIALSDLQSNTIAQFWADTANSVTAVKKGAKIVMSPARKAYLDMQYDSTTKLGLHWAGYVEVDTGYMWDPATLIKGINKENIIGIEAPLWTETITKMDEMEYMVFPRLPGYAEIGWSLPANRNWDEYKVRLAKHAPRMQMMEIDFYKSPKIKW